ncbi:hypothetical protein HDU83_004393 [Entophlyctis luteolus]|nr:hypothetical protein HDU82_007163 [Entophlyctis luteolus]KAJ3345142.1 hypothetical protein HDU83_004393 [Entophlyctis luteolus]KAJ3384167.1 hypothetical protein HDU84_003108 [Entophlyctis sp. JEL0112]
MSSSEATSHIDAVEERRKSQQLEAAAEISAEIDTWKEKSEIAKELKTQSVEEKRSKAHAFLEDAAAGHARAQLHDAIRESETRFEYKSHQLKSDLAQDRRASHIELVKEKQKTLQGKKHSSQDTIVDEI